MHKEKCHFILAPAFAILLQPTESHLPEWCVIKCRCCSSWVFSIFTQAQSLCLDKWSLCWEVSDSYNYGKSAHSRTLKGHKCPNLENVDYTSFWVASSQYINYLSLSLLATFPCSPVFPSGSMFVSLLGLSLWWSDAFYLSVDLFWCPWTDSCKFLFLLIKVFASPNCRSLSNLKMPTVWG